LSSLFPTAHNKRINIIFIFHIWKFQDVITTINHIISSSSNAIGASNLSLVFHYKDTNYSHRSCTIPKARGTCLRL